MSAAFTFDFTSDDIDEDEQNDPLIVAQDNSRSPDNVLPVPPQLHTLHEIVRATFSGCRNLDTHDPTVVCSKRRRECVLATSLSTAFRP